MTSATIGAISRLERLAGIALPAVRGIGSREVRGAALLGLAVTTWNYVCFVVPIMEISQSIPFLPGLVGSIISQQIRAFCLMVAIVVADRAVDEGAPRRRTYVLAAVFGCLVGLAASEPVGWAWRTYVLPDRWPEGWPWLHGTAALFYWPLFSITQWLPIGAGVVFLYADRRAARRTARLLQDAELDRIRRSRVALESRLQAMQARVEPQFLFNTLAQVERLYETDPALAARMLDDLIAYLRAAMPAMRDTSSTVGQEVELVRAYLDIVRLPLGDRLRVSIDVPAGIRDARMPPMMLLPLVDHEVVRGLEHATAGGTIGIAARVGGGRLTLTIDDRGAGLVPETDDDGVAAIRQRLDALYRGDAKLDLRRSGPQTTAAVLDLPVEAEGPVEGPAPPAKD